MAPTPRRGIKNELSLAVVPGTTDANVHFTTGTWNTSAFFLFISDDVFIVNIKADSSW